MEKFSAALQKFIDFSLEVANYGPGGQLSSSGNPIHARIWSYNNIFQDTKDSRKHQEKLQEVYAKCKLIISQAKNLEEILIWFKDTSFTVQPKEGAKSGLPISIVYRKCCDIVKSREEIEEPSILDYYREVFLYYLLGVFLTLEKDEATLEILEYYSKQIRDTLNIKDDDFDPKDPFSSMIKTCMNAVKEAGLDLPQGNMDLNDLSRMGNDFLQSPVMKETLVGLFRDIKNSNPKRPEDMITSLLATTMQKLGNGNMPQELQKAMQSGIEQ
ncbi:MAG: hypothetical protein ACYCQJ_14205 [Nitrososphaerales archaeon]